MSFARLFDTPHGQLLYTLEGEDDDGMWPMKVRGESTRCIPEVSNLYHTEEARLTQFEALDQAKADATAAEIHRMVEGMLGGKA